MKRSTCLFLAFFLMAKCAFAFDSLYFRGYAGFLGDFTSNPAKDSLDLQLFPRGYFAGQLDVGDRLFIRSEFLVQSSSANPSTNLFSGDFFESPKGENANFRIQELSATYRLNGGGATHYFSGFYGEYEPIGSDIFLQRYLGTNKITSELTESWIGLNGVSINKFYGGGLSYTLRFDAPVAAGVSFYKDFYQEQERAYNLDIRLAGIFSFLTFDASAGLEIPKSSRKVHEKKYILAVQYLVLHAGLNMLVGLPSDTATLFIQGGFSDLLIDPDADKTVDLEDIAESFSLLLEPRISLRQVKLAFSAFSLNPENLSTGMYIYLQDALGFDIHISTNYFHLGSTNFTLGLHTTFGLNYQDGTGGYLTLKSAIDDKDNASDWQKNIYLTPYTDIPVKGGNISSSFTFRVNELFKFKDNWESNIHFRLGFRSEF